MNWDNGLHNGHNLRVTYGDMGSLVLELGRKARGLMAFSNLLSMDLGNTKSPHNSSSQFIAEMSQKFSSHSCICLVKFVFCITPCPCG